MRLHYFDQAALSTVAYAIYADGQAVLYSAAHRLHFSPAYLPAIPPDDRQVYCFARPCPHLAAHNTFSLCGRPYRLVLLLPVEDPAAYMPVLSDDAPLRPARDLFTLLLSYTVPRHGTFAPLSLPALLCDCRDALAKQTGLPLAEEGPRLLPGAAACLDREALLLSLGILAPYLVQAGQVQILCGEDTPGTFSLSLLFAGGVENGFLRQFLAAVAEHGGFSLFFSPDGVRFFLPFFYTEGLLLKAGDPMADLAMLQLGALLGPLSPQGLLA